MRGGLEAGMDMAVKSPSPSVHINPMLGDLHIPVASPLNPLGTQVQVGKGAETGLAYSNGKADEGTEVARQVSSNFVDI